MIRGSVNARRPTVNIVLRLPQGELAIESVIDTGFCGSLALPLDSVAALKLPFDIEI